MFKSAISYSCWLINLIVKVMMINLNYKLGEPGPMQWDCVWLFGLHLFGQSEQMKFNNLSHKVAIAVHNRINLCMKSKSKLEPQVCICFFYERFKDNAITSRGPIGVTDHSKYFLRMVGHPWKRLDIFSLYFDMRVPHHASSMSINLFDRLRQHHHICPYS
jgi:hypothetical protein